MARETIDREGSTGALGRASWLLVGAAVLSIGVASPAMAQDTTATAAPAPTVKVDPKITVEALKRAAGPNILMKGKGFTPLGSVRVLGTNPPGASKRLDFGTIKADSTGAFTLRKEEACTTDDVALLGRPVTFTVTDEASKKSVTGRVDGGPWGC